MALEQRLKRSQIIKKCRHACKIQGIKSENWVEGVIEFEFLISSFVAEGLRASVPAHRLPPR